jgi:hypothetical protein
MAEKRRQTTFNSPTNQEVFSKEFFKWPEGVLMEENHRQQTSDT